MDDKQKAKDEAFREYLLNDPASKAGDKYPFMRGWDEHAAASAQPATDLVEAARKYLTKRFGYDSPDFADPELMADFASSVTAALSSRLAEAEEILKSAKSVIAGHGCRMNHEGCSRCYLRWEIHEYEKQHGELDMSGYKYPKGENL